MVFGVLSKLGKVLFKIDFNGGPHWQALVSLAEEIAKSGIPRGTKKVHGKYIQSHLFSRLEGSNILLLHTAQCVVFLPAYWSDH